MLVQGKRYLIQARFMYGNYDSRKELPEFDVYLGVTLSSIVKIENASKVVDAEIMHTASADSLFMCLVSKGFGTPFISAIELRPTQKDGLYATEPESLEFQ